MLFPPQIFRLLFRQAFLKIFTLLLLCLPVSVLAQAEISEKFFCKAQNRILTDDDFVRLALGRELEIMRDSLMRNGFVYRHFGVPLEGYEISSVDEFLETNPSCCRVVRDPKHMRRRSTSWLMRLDDWLDGEQILTLLLIPSNTVGEPMVSIDYYTDECGEINYDRSYTISIFHFTE